MFLIWIATLVADYASFARSFTQIRAQDIRDQVDAVYTSRRFWPEPLITINPHFEQGASVEALVADGSLRPDVARVFRVDGQSITLYRHQMQAVAKATARQSFAVTTGTGSGKSLCFFIPIIDAAIRARTSGEEPRTRAIVIYPMNALANSQREELNKFLDQSGLPENLRPTFARYTGQEGEDERKRIRDAKPDILLTNFMMLELLMTRQDKLDQTVIENAQGLDFIILDELHTYRGRQGADVAMLVRRLRDRLCRDRVPLCIGTSATMSSQDDETERAIAVANVASRLFGTDIPPHAVIDETLERATDPKLKPQSLGAALLTAIDADLPATLTDKVLRSHPLAVWNGHVAAPKIGILRLVVIADSDSEAEAAARAAHETWYRSITQLWHAHGDHSIDGLFSWESSLATKSLVYGAPGRVREDIQDLVAASGCNYVICSFAWGTLSFKQSLRSLRLFAQEVMPAFLTT